MSMEDFELTPKEKAVCLVRLVETHSLKTAGYWVDWIERVNRLPQGLQKWVWKKVRVNLPDDAVRYLKTWRKLPGSF